MEEIVPNIDTIDIEGQTSNSVSNMDEGQGNSDTEEQIANFICEEQASQWFNELKTTFQRHRSTGILASTTVMSCTLVNQKI